VSNSLVSMSTKAGEPVKVRDRLMVPFAQVLSIRLPKIPVGFIWYRPASVLIINQDGREDVLPITDVTRRIQIILLGTGLIGSIMIWITFNLIRRSRS
jgi:hypothetical protein